MRFNLNTVFVLIAVVAFGAWAWRLFDQSESRIMARFRQAGGVVYYLDDSGIVAAVPDCPADREAMLAALRELHDLQIISFRSYPYDSTLAYLPEYKEITRPADVQFIPAAKLKEIRLFGRAIRDEDVLRLRPSPRLVGLHFRFTDVTGSCLDRFASDRLRRLSFDECPFSAESAHYLARCSQLEEFEIIAGGRKHDGSLLTVVHFGDAELTYVCQPKRLQWLSLSGTGVTDDGVCMIAQHLPQLKFLFLMNTPITDNAVQHLSTLKNLRRLWLGSDCPEKCLISEAACMHLINCLPDCGIEFQCGTKWIRSWELEELDSDVPRSE